MNIDRELWLKLQAPFDQLINRSPEARAQAIKQFGLNDQEQGVLLSLLDASDRSADMNLSAPERLKLSDAPEAVDWTGRELGPWKVLEPLAKGGMGVVYLGERADGEFSKRVAIKVLDASLQDNSQRLKEEIRILARLEHPGIARLIDSGSAEQGHPWLVMELIEGHTATEYFQQHPATVRSRIQCIIQIAEALEYAHQRRVIHCDIKPDNVLIRDDGRPCLVDFGISSLTERADDPEQQRRNKYYSRQYSAPERLQGSPPEAAQDIFSLGALMQRLLRDQPDLPTDLQAIIGRAMADQPNDRYGSMSAFRDDLNAWLDRRPVQARNAGSGYVLTRWLQRHAVAASLFSLLILSLLAGLLVSLNQTSLARAEAERANAVKNVLVDIFIAADPAEEDGNDPPASELLRRGAAKIPEDLSAHPHIQAELLQTIGLTQYYRGLIDDAPKSMDFALNLYQELPPDNNYASLLADRAMVHYEHGEIDQAIEKLEASRDLIQQQNLDHPDELVYQVRLADMYLIKGRFDDSARLSLDVIEADTELITTEINAWRVRGAALENLREFEQSEQALQTAVELQRSHDPDDVFLATILNDLMILRYSQNRMEEARTIIQEVVEIQQRIYGKSHPRVITSIGNLAATEMALGDYDSAASRFRASIEALRALHGDDAHPSTIYNKGMLGIVHYYNQDLETAFDFVQLAHQDYLNLVERSEHSLDWIEPLLGLLSMELGQSEHEALIDQFPSTCESIGQVSPLTRRLCLAKTLRQLEAANGCTAEVNLPDASEQDLAELNNDWLQIYRWLSAQCAGEPNEQDFDDLPAWFRARV